MSRIEWTETTWNPVVGCSRVSAGCKNCYAERMAMRVAASVEARVNDRAVREFDVAVEPPSFAYTKVVRRRPDGSFAPRWNGRVQLIPEVLAKPLRWQKPRLVFVNSMSDLFHRGLSDTDIAAVFGVMAACPQHTFQVLTKRADRLPVLGTRSFRERMAVQMPSVEDGDLLQDSIRFGEWPLPNVHLGVSTEDQHTANERIPYLLDTPAALRWVSAEPLLGPLDLSPYMDPAGSACCGGYSDSCSATPSGCVLNRWPWCDRQEGHASLDWVVVGGESGPRARPCKLEWIRDVVRQCREAGVPVFVKQLGTVLARELGLRDRKGGDIDEWPEDLRVREWPGEVAP